MVSEVSHETHSWRLLAEIEAGRGRSQRSMAREAGIALGLANLLLRQMVRQGWVRLVRVKPNRALYLITPAGLVEKARLWRAYLARNARFYAETRDRVRESLGRLSAACDADARCGKRIVLYGAGDVAEIAYVCLRHSDLDLIGVVDEHRTRFFDVPVKTLDALCGLDLDGRPFDQIVVTDVGDTAAVQAVTLRLSDRGIPAERIAWL
jgi:hypothetical protein